MGLCQRYKDVYFYLSHPTNDSLLEGFFIPFFLLGVGAGILYLTLFGGVFNFVAMFDGSIPWNLLR